MVLNEDAVQVLLDKQACAELVYKLARSIDRCDERLMRSLWTPGATDDHGGFKGTAGEFVDWVLPVLQRMKRTQHVISNVLIEVKGDTAFGESYFVAHHTLAGPEGGDIFMVAGGRYLDRFERQFGQWKIAHRHAVYDWNASEPSTDSWNREAPGPQSFGGRGHSDVSYAHFAGRLGPGRG